MVLWRDLRRSGLNTDKKVYVIAEAGINHGGNVETAKRLIESAARTGCDAVKFQTYRTETRVSKSSPIFDILKRCELPFEDFMNLKATADSEGIEFMSTPFDKESSACLESIGSQIYKVASVDVVNKSFLLDIAKKGQAVIMSTGMADLGQVDNAVRIFEQEGVPLSLLHCVSSYPLEYHDANLSSIGILRSRYSNVIGFSDHSADLRLSELSIACGAQIVERHFKISDDCVDASISISESQLRELVEKINDIVLIMGEGEYGLLDAEKECLSFRRFS